MTNLFVKSVKNKPPVKSKTFNGAVTFESTTNPCVDLFFIIGASRGKDITSAFEKAYAFNEDLTLRMLFWARDIRQGSGERQTFRNLFQYLEKNRPSVAIKLVKLVPEYGRWDDLLIFKTKALQTAAFSVIKAGLENKDTQGLCAKWMPRKGYVAKQLREFLKLSPKAYRKTLVNLSKDVVEVKMCAKQWTEINFSHVPSLAAARYQKAFNKNCGQAYVDYRNALTSKDPVVRATAKINAGAVYPHDVVKSIIQGDKEVAKAQWESLPNYLGEANILPVLDVSGSMGSFDYYGTGSVKGTARPIDICISLGLYLSDKQAGAFKDIVCTFSNKSELVHLKGDIISKAKQCSTMEWGMNTNLEAAFANILKVAVQNKVPASDMPDMLLIISDMEFDQCVSQPSKTIYEKARQEYQRRGYNLPKVVFWNVNARVGNNPVTIRDNNTALVSGYSPAVLKTILKGDVEQFTPVSVMKQALNIPRYDAVSEALQS